MNKFKLNFLSVFIIFLVTSLAGLSSIYSYEQIITYIFIPLGLIIGIAFNNHNFRSIKNTYSVIFLGILLLSFVLLSISQNLEVAFTNLVKLLGVYLVILMTIEFISFRKYILLERFLIAYVVAFVTLATFLILGIRDKGIDLSANWIDRSQFDLNANVYSYFSYFANISLFYLIHYTKKRLYILLSFVCLILGVYVSFFTVSRSGILFTLLLGTIYWLFIFQRNRSNTLKRIPIVLFLLGIGFSYLYKIYNNSFLKLRVDRSVESGDSRETLARDAINVFLDYPITGVGPGQYYLYAFNQHSFSHNSYTEIAANLGIVGLVLLLILFVRPLIKEFKIRGIKKDKTLSSLNILFFASFILLNNIYVFYLTTYGMMFFFIVIMIQKKALSDN